MSTATLVPETWELTGDDAWRTLRDIGRLRLLRDAFMRMRFSDGFSHVRSLAFLMSLVLVQATIVLVGIASALGDTHLSEAIVSAIQGAVPGPAGQVLTVAVGQAHAAGVSRRYLGLALGSVGLIVSATTGMGQMERVLNRIYGVELDRPFPKKYGRGLILALSAGSLMGVAFVAVGFGSTVGDSLHNEPVHWAWTVMRWPVALVIMIAVTALLFRWCPRRHQPNWSWLAFGSTVSVVLWLGVTLAMGEVFRASHSFGDTYGPLAGIVALQIWCMLSSMAIIFGGSVTAQLEAERSGRRAPQDQAKVEHAEPDVETNIPQPVAS
jgi:YihY family inner membrane protein